MTRDLDTPPPDDSPGERENATPSIPTQRYDLQILTALRRVMRAVDIHSRRLIATHHITAPQLVCLITIVDNGPITLKQLAEGVFLSPSTVVGILDRLEAKGFVLRARDTRDRRLVNVSATASGRHLVENAPSPLQAGLARALKRLPEIEQATITLSLQRIVDLMHAETLDASPVLDVGPSLDDRGDATSDDEETRKGS